MALFEPFPILKEEPCEMIIICAVYPPHADTAVASDVEDAVDALRRFGAASVIQRSYISVDFDTAASRLGSLEA